jgi:stage II sporulation SpoE-like protein
MNDVSEQLLKQEQEVQLRLAHQVQQQFYRPAPSLSGFDIAGAAYPAYETSGDYFDFITMPHGSLCIAVGDVEGLGFGSALVMALTRAYVRSFVALGLEVDQILTQVNRMLLQDLGDGFFVTLSLDVRSRSLVYAGAGHVPGYILERVGYGGAHAGKQRASPRTVSRHQIFPQFRKSSARGRDSSSLDRWSYRIERPKWERIGRRPRAEVRAPTSRRKRERDCGQGLPDSTRIRIRWSSE